MPYIRDTRRSIGLDDFVMKVTDITGIAEQMTGFIFDDHVALGAYDVDIHGLRGCKYPSYMFGNYPVLPYFIPYRSLTNAKYTNLMVAGKTIAQSFLVNAATRLHPVEWSSGTAAGVIASYLATHGMTTRQGFQFIHQIQPLVSLYTPIQWTINGTKYPPHL